MKLASYALDGRESFGAVNGEGLLDLGEAFAGRCPTLRDLLAADLLDEARSTVARGGPQYKLSDVRLRPVIPNPDKIICVGFNYKAHADEAGLDVPKQPTVFARLANTLLGHGDNMVRPRVSKNFDFEGELAVIIGRHGRYVSEADALDYVAGYSCFNEGSLRDYQKQNLTAGKNFPATGPFGPWMVTTDEIPDPTKLQLTTRLNGQEMQKSGTDMLVYSIPTIISYISEFTFLEPGDVIATGTPAGVGHRRNPQVFMKPGDVIEIEISGIGTLRNQVVDE